MSMEQERRTRRGSALIAIAALAAAALFVAILVSAFRLGMATALAAAGGGFVAYQVPATIRDWPRVTLDDVWAFFAALWEWFLGLFDW